MLSGTPSSSSSVPPSFSAAGSVSVSSSILREGRTEGAEGEGRVVTGEGDLGVRLCAVVAVVGERDMLWLLLVLLEDLGLSDEEGEGEEERRRGGGRQSSLEPSRR